MLAGFSKKREGERTELLFSNEGSRYIWTIFGGTDQLSVRELWLDGVSMEADGRKKRRNRVSGSNLCVRKTPGTS